MVIQIVIIISDNTTKGMNHRMFFKSWYMLSHHVTSSRLLVHFAMEQHLHAATPGFLRKFHFFALVNKTKFLNSKDSVP